MVAGGKLDAVLEEVGELGVATFAPVGETANGSPGAAMGAPMAGSDGLFSASPLFHGYPVGRLVFGIEEDVMNQSAVKPFIS